MLKIGVFEKFGLYFNRLLVYGPLALFLFAGSYALLMGSSQVFKIKPVEQQQMLFDELTNQLNEYKSNCVSRQLLDENTNCVEEFVNDTLLSKTLLLESQYNDLSGNYSVIAIITGFFGVLMTVLVIHFSLTGKEAFQERLKILDQKLTDAQKNLTDATSKLKEIETVLSETKAQQNNMQTDIDNAKETSSSHEKMLNDIKSKYIKDNEGDTSVIDDSLPEGSGPSNELPKDTLFYQVYRKSLKLNFLEKIKDGSLFISIPFLKISKMNVAAKGGVVTVTLNQGEIKDLGQTDKLEVNVTRSSNPATTSEIENYIFTQKK